MSFWHPKEEAPESQPPEGGYAGDRWLCLVRYRGKVHPEVTVWFAEKKAFSLPRANPNSDCEADWLKLSEIDAWAYLRDLPPWFE